MTGQTNSLQHRPVALSNTWTLYLDPTDSFKVAGRFGSRGAISKTILHHRSRNSFQMQRLVVDLDNRCRRCCSTLFEGLEPILSDTKNRTRMEQALHDSTRMAIARSVWMTLVADAMSAVFGTLKMVKIQSGQSGGGMQKYLGVYCQRSMRDDPETELLRLAATEWRRHPGSSTFLSRAEAAVGEIIQANKFLRKTIQNLMREGVSHKSTSWPFVVRATITRRELPIGRSSDDRGFAQYEVSWDRRVDIGPMLTMVDEAMRRFRNDPKNRMHGWLLVYMQRATTRREAADRRIWYWLSVIGKPNYVRWRWSEAGAKTVPINRFMGEDSKNSFGRLWWAAELTRNGNDYSETESVPKSQRFSVL